MEPRTTPYRHGVLPKASQLKRASGGDGKGREGTCPGNVQMLTPDGNLDIMYNVL